MNIRLNLVLKRFFVTKPWSYKEATEWQQAFNQGQIPKEHVSIAFSRSSGPGGQNVNKGFVFLEYILDIVHLPDTF
jgi:protein subunit release factor A